MASAFGGQRSIQLSYGCGMLVQRAFLRRSETKALALNSAGCCKRPGDPSEFRKAAKASYQRVAREGLFGAI